MRTWLLPEYIEDILPDEAGRVEALRRSVLDEFGVHGYELVMPPLLEYVESLLTGTGHDLDLQTFKLVDQLSGRMLGIRADMTPQVARMDAHLLNRKGVTRLCYAGSVLRTRPDGMNRTREPLQIGAEIYGHAGVESDIEIQRLMLKVLTLAGLSAVSIDIGHVGVFRALLRQLRIDAEAERDLFRAVQAKDAAALTGLTKRMPSALRKGFQALPGLYGDMAVLRRAGRELPALPGVRKALAELAAVSRGLGESADIRSFDLGELRGYRYHTGVVFAAYASTGSGPLAAGGRYDEVGRAFGRARPATGFTMDLRELASAGGRTAARRRVLAPWRPGDSALQRRIAALRQRGTVVIEELPGHAAARDELACDHALVRKGGQWVLRRRT